MTPNPASTALRQLMPDDENVSTILSFYEELDLVYQESLVVAGLAPAVAKTGTVNTAECTVTMPNLGSVNEYYVAK